MTLVEGAWGSLTQGHFLKCSDLGLCLDWVVLVGIKTWEDMHRAEDSLGSQVTEGEEEDTQPTHQALIVGTMGHPHVFWEPVTNKICSFLPQKTPK